MEFQTNFKFLKLQEITRKNAEELKEGEKTFFKIDLLDNQNNPCSFMVFKTEVKEKIIKMQLKSLQDVLIAFSVTYNKNWNVNLIDIDIR